jgi:hypothetical protein
LNHRLFYTSKTNTTHQHPLPPYLFCPIDDIFVKALTLLAARLEAEPAAELPKPHIANPYSILTLSACNASRCENPELFGPGMLLATHATSSIGEGAS